MIEANRTLVRRWFQEVWNEGREETIDELFAQYAVAYGLGDREAAVRGAQQFKPFFRNLRGAIPDIRISIEDMLADEDKVAVRVLLTGTHTGLGLGVAPTGNRIHVAGIVLVRILEGQIIEGWNSWDQLGLLRQIGAIPTAEGDDQFLSVRSSVQE